MFDQDGKFSQSTRKRCLDLLGFGKWEDSVDLTTLNIQRAKEENLQFLKNKQAKILPIDDHQIHIDEHSAFVLCEIDNRLTSEQLASMLTHIEEHKRLLKAGSENEDEENKN